MSESTSSSCILRPHATRQLKNIRNIPWHATNPSCVTTQIITVIILQIFILVFCVLVTWYQLRTTSPMQLEWNFVCLSIIVWNIPESHNTGNFFHIDLSYMKKENCKISILGNLFLPCNISYYKKMLNNSYLQTLRVTYSFPRWLFSMISTARSRTLSHICIFAFNIK